jgi:hypothetical protein
MTPLTPFQRLVNSLSFQPGEPTVLHAIAPHEWPALLRLTDQTQLTLPLAVRHREQCPEHVRSRLEQNLASNAVRHQMLLREYGWIADALERRSVEFLFLKGITHIAPLFVADRAHRPQYDIDLYCRPESLESAREALLDAGFMPMARSARHVDHLPPMIRNRNWQWRDDYYATDLPLTVEVHFRFWDPATEQITAPCSDAFWERRIKRRIDGYELSMLSLADSICYAALHLMRHLLRGDARIYHVYEMAYVLHQTQADDALWRLWSEQHCGVGVSIEAAAFRFAADWFKCGLHPVAADVIANLPSTVTQWFELFSSSPLWRERPNKDELLLHLALASDLRSRSRILARRLLPVRAPRISYPKAITKPCVTLRLKRVVARLAFVLARAAHHLLAFVSLLGSIVRWKRESRRYAG